MVWALLKQLFFEQFIGYHKPSEYAGLGSVIFEKLHKQLRL